MKVARKCPHCGLESSKVNDGTYRCELATGGCGGTFTIGTGEGHRRAPGLHQMDQRYRFVGGRIGNLDGQGGQGTESFNVEGISPNVEAQRVRKMQNTGLGVLRDQLQGLMDSAEMPEEVAYWLDNLERLRGML